MEVESLLPQSEVISSFNSALWQDKLMCVEVLISSKRLEVLSFSRNCWLMQI